MDSIAAIQALLSLSRVSLEKANPDEPDSIIPAQLRTAAGMCGRLAAITKTVPGSQRTIQTPELAQAVRLLLEAAELAASGNRRPALDKLAKAEEFIHQTGAKPSQKRSP